MQLFKSYYRKREILTEIEKVLDVGWTATGKNCKDFEDKWNQFIGCCYSHYLHSCTAALHIALRLLDLPEGSSIITTPITFVSTNAVILYENMAKCQVSLKFRFVVVLVGLVVLSMPSCTWPNFDHCCQPMLPSTAQRSFTWVKKLPINCCGTLIPTLMFAVKSPLLLSRVLRPGPGFENSAGALKSRLTWEFQVSPNRVPGSSS